MKLFLKPAGPVLVFHSDFVSVIKLDYIIMSQPANHTSPREPYGTDVIVQQGKIGQREPEEGRERHI